VVQISEERQGELESLWYEVVQAVNAGRTNGLVCPECSHPDGLTVEEQAGRVSVSCPNCKRLLEVQVNTA
jgi:transcription elongation factor Elf1